MIDALAGIRVLEFTTNIAGSLVGQTLAALGADVVKVERPETGDDCRAFGPPFARGTSMMFNAMNRGKRGVSLDLKQPSALAWVDAHLENCDVLVENMRPGAMAEIGLGSDALRARFPRLVYCSLSAFGASGPLRDKPGYEEVVQAFSGLFSVNGDEAGAPSRIGYSALDLGTGVWGALGCLAALMQRERTGQGCTVTGSLLETAIGWLVLPIASYTASGALPVRARSGGPAVCVYRCFRTEDGEIMIAAANDRLFAKLCEAVDRPEWAADERYRTGRRRVEHRAFLHAALEPIIARHSSAHWIGSLERAGVPCAPVNDLAGVLADPHVRQLDLFDALEDSSALFARVPLRFDGVRPATTIEAPAIGAHDAMLKVPPSAH